MSTQKYNIREEYPINTLVTFKPKELITGEPLLGIVKEHLFGHVLIIRSYNRNWQVAVFKCKKVK